MRRFTELFQALDSTTKTTEKVRALATYFTEAPERDRDRALFLLSGGTLKRRVNSTELREWAGAIAGVPLWLVEESYHTVGDLAETIALLLPPPSRKTERSLADWIEYLDRLGSLERDERRIAVTDAWDELPQQSRFLFNKLITGGFRVGVAKTLVIRAVSQVTGIPVDTVAHRLSGSITLESASFDRLNEAPGEGGRLNPYPFFLAYPLEVHPRELGSIEEWQAEWKWDGIRGQIVRRDGGFAVWSRGEELVTDRFPELQPLATLLPSGTVLDGEIICWKNGSPLPFSALQTRIGRKSVGAKLLSEAPVAFLAYDLLEHQGVDMRDRDLRERRDRLERIVGLLGSEAPAKLSPVLTFSSWDDSVRMRLEAGRQRAEGLMLKRLGSPYQVGRKKGDWWKWKLDPFTIDAVLIYAQKGHGRRANLYTDYTFAVWKESELIPFAKAYSGLTDAEISEVDRFVKSHTKERFGPVRTVEPKLVFEIAFEGIQRSKRHKSGIAVRFPRILRWRRDKPISEANSLADLESLVGESRPATESEDELPTAP